MSRLPIGDISGATPVNADKVLGVDISDSSKGKLFGVADLLGVGASNWAEVRNDGSEIIAIGNGADTDLVFDTNKTGSAAAAGDADAGTVLTADQANNGIIVPAKTRVLVEAQVDFSVAVSDLVALKVQADGSDVAELILSTSAVFDVGPPLISVNPAVYWNGIYDNSTASPVTLTVVGRSTLQASLAITTTRASLRGSWVADLP